MELRPPGKRTDTRFGIAAHGCADCRPGRARRPALAAWLLLPALLFACAAAGAAPDFGFGLLEIYKFENGTSQLMVRDVNLDGRDDILFANNKGSRLEVLLRKPAPDKDKARFQTIETAFDNKGFAVDQQILAYDLADMNGDRAPDLLILGREQGLELRIQGKDGAFEAPRKIYLERMDTLVSLQTGDLNEDGRRDAVVGRFDKAEILWNAGAGAFTSRTELAFGSSNGRDMDIADFNGDGHLDGMFYFSSETMPLRFRPGDGKGGFGMEHLFPMPAVKAVHKLELAGRKQAALGSIPRSGRVFRVHVLASETRADALARDEVIPQRLPLKGMGQKFSPAWAAADFDRDGLEDFVVAAPELSRVHIYKGAQGGLNPEPLAIDSLSGITALSLAGDNGILVFSPSEKAVALHEGARLEAFPRLLPAPDKTVLAAALPWADSYMCMARSGAQGKMELSIRSLSGASTNSEPRRLALDMANDPESVKVFQLGSPDVFGVLCLIPYQPPEMFVVQGDEATKLSPQAFSALAQPAAAAAFAVPDAPDGRRLLVAQGSVVRDYRWKAPAYEALGQVNPGNENAQVSVCARFNMGGKDGVMLHDRNSGNLVWQPAESQAAALRTHLACPIPDIAGMVQLQAKDPARSTLLMIGRSELFMLRNGAIEYSILEEGEYASPAENPALFDFNSVRLGRGRRPMAAITDARNRSIELISRQDPGWRKEVIFEVFQNPGFSGSESMPENEPRDVKSGDIDGDGLRDLAVLVHDKLIVYPGE